MTEFGWLTSNPLHDEPGEATALETTSDGWQAVYDRDVLISPPVYAKIPLPEYAEAGWYRVEVRVTKVRGPRDR